MLPLCLPSEPPLIHPGFKLTPSMVAVFVVACAAPVTPHVPTEAGKWGTGDWSGKEAVSLCFADAGQPLTKEIRANPLGLRIPSENAVPDQLYVSMPF